MLKKVARSGADVFVPYFAGSDQIKLLTQFTEMGLKNRMAVVMGHYDEMMVSKLPASVREGFYSSNSYFMSINTPENQQYLKRLAEQPGVEGIWPNGNGILTNFGEGVYQCVHAFAKAINKAKVAEVEALVDELEVIEVTGPQGKVQMQARTHHAKVNSYLSCCNANGTFNIVKHFKSVLPVIPERYQHHAEIDLRKKPSGSAITKSHVINDAAQKILSFVEVVILVTDEAGIIIEANRSACQLFGYTCKELIGMSIHFLLPPNYRDRHAESLRQFVLSDETERRMNQRNSVMGYRKDGTFVELEAGIAKFYNRNQWVLVVTMLDITQRKREEQKLIWESTHDVLTGLPNRRLIHERLNRALQLTLRNKENVALLFIDLDGFKLINDTYSHEAGDVVLKTISDRLLNQVRPGDTVGRLSGDEFIVLCEHIEDPELIMNLAVRINNALRECIEHNKLSLFVTASIGIAVGNGDQYSANEMLRSADAAMYEMKQKGRDGWQFFSDKLQKQMDHKNLIIQGLRRALENNEFSTVLQPIVTTTDGQIVGAELLLRWTSKEEVMSPAAFIPIAEMTGIILPIGDWVFREGCKAQVNWRRYWGDRAPYVSINLSARQLNQKHLARGFADILQETGADPTHILLEITETVLMLDMQSNLLVLKQLADMGLKIAIDDFGTGYSSLSQLIHFPVDILKIDKLFIDGIEDQYEKRLLIRTIINLGHSLGLKLVAEGVETEMQLTELKEYGCDFIQGYFFFRPMEARVFINTMNNHVINK